MVVYIFSLITFSDSFYFHGNIYNSSLLPTVKNRRDVMSLKEIEVLGFQFSDYYALSYILL